MKSILDSQSYSHWSTQETVLKDGQLRLVLAEFEIAKNSNTRQVIVHFDDVLCLQVYDEFVRLEDYAGEEREEGIVALHKNSALLAWLKESTILHDVTPGELLHYSVLTSYEYYHVVTREPPKVYDE